MFKGERSGLTRTTMAPAVPAFRLQSVPCFVGTGRVDVKGESEGTDLGVPWLIFAATQSRTRRRKRHFLGLAAPSHFGRPQIRV